MLPKIHFIAGVFFIALIYLIFPSINQTGLLLILASSVLIDADHCLYYFIKEKNLNLIECYRWYKKHREIILALPMKERKKRYTGFYIFHGIEWLIILFLISRFIFPNFIFIFMGFSFHWIIDVPHKYYIKGTFHKLSLIYSYTQWKKLEK